MSSSYDYDLIVIGAGIAGMVSAVTASGLGKRVAVIEKSKVGGNCTNTTCIPSKALISLGHKARARDGFPGVGRPDTRLVMPQINRIVERAYRKDLPETFEDIGITVLSGAARFTGPSEVEVAGRVYQAAAFIIASGTRPLIPPIPGLKTVDYLTNETLYDLDDLPESILILGGGVDGLEYAGAFSGLGVKTTVVEASGRWLPTADAEAVRMLTASMKQAGILLAGGTQVQNVAKGADGVIALCRAQDGRSLELSAEKLLVAVGRVPDLESLGLEKAGVAFNQRGIITDRTLRTSARHIYACGDIAGPYLLATTAESQAIVAATNAVLPVKRRVDDGNNIFVVFTDPPLAWIGLTEAEARERLGAKLKVYRFPYAGMRRALVDGNETGIAKILHDRRGRIVGAHLLGEGAPEVIHELQLLRALNQPLQSLQAVTHAYPTYAQAIAGRAGQLAFLDRMKNSFWVNLALNILPGFSNQLQKARDRLAETHPQDPFAVWQPDAPESAKRPMVTIATRRADDETVIVEISGKLTDGAGQSLADALENARPYHRMLWNLSGLAGMDVEGAGLLAVAAAQACNERKDIMACGLSAPLRNAFKLTGMNDAVSIYDNEKDALCCREFIEKSGLTWGSAAGNPGTALPGWASPVECLALKNIPAAAVNINVAGRRLSGPLQGFGRLWEKRYRLALAETDLTCEEIIALWRAGFASFWPKGNLLYPSGNAAIEPGTVALLNLAMPGGLILATGLMVIAADERSFSFMTAQGHILSGWITFSCFRAGNTVMLEVHPLFRASDPLMELGFHLGAGRQEDTFWREVLARVAIRLGTHGDVAQKERLCDPHVQCKQFFNIRYSAALRSALYLPWHLLKKAWNKIRGAGRKA